MFDLVLSKGATAPGKTLLSLTNEDAAEAIRDVIQNQWDHLFQVEGLGIHIRQVARAPGEESTQPPRAFGSALPVLKHSDHQATDPDDQIEET